MRLARAHPGSPLCFRDLTCRRPYSHHSGPRCPRECWKQKIPEDPRTSPRFLGRSSGLEHASQLAELTEPFHPGDPTSERLRVLQESVWAPWGPAGVEAGIPRERPRRGCAQEALEEDPSAEIRQGRSDQDSSPCPTQPQSHAQTPAASRHMHRLPRWLGAGSSNRRRGRRRCRST